MPTKVPSPSESVAENVTNRRARIAEDGIHGLDQPAELGLGVEERARKRLQKGAPERMASYKRPNDQASSNGVIDPISTFASRRRQSMRDQRGPLGPRPPESSSFKLYAPEVPSDLFTPNNRPSTAKASLNSHSRQASINNSSRFSFASTAPSVKDDASSSVPMLDFLPSVNFDDLQTSLSTSGTNLNLKDLRVSRAELTAPTQATRGDATASVLVGGKAPSTLIGLGESTSRIGRNGSLRQPNTNIQQSNRPADNQFMGVQTVPLPTRAQRQSQFSSSAANISAYRSPRKSMGPGVLAIEGADGSHGLQRPLGAQLYIPTHGAAMESHDSAQSRVTSAPEDALHVKRSRQLTLNRDLKTKSLVHPPLPPNRNNFSTSPMNLGDSRPFSIGAAHTSSSLSARVAESDASQRMSVLSPHATGLGARTISPTDARRMRRLSILPNPPPIPQTPSTPLPDRPPSGVRSAAPSPSLIPRKSITPSSARTTPDHHRKSINSTASIASTTSFNSWRTSSGSLQPRIVQSISTSRLPTPKSRNESILNGEGREVPPVPAIPKAFESPKGEFDGPLFSSRNSSLAASASNLSGISSNNTILMNQTEKNISKHPSQKERRPDIPVASDAEIGRRPIGTANANRRTLQPIRLPPLNLLPLSTPTAAKIAALNNQPPANDNRTVTPSLKRDPIKTPSTPMTASRTSFFAGSNLSESSVLPVVQTRSRSSQYAFKPETQSNRGASSSSSTIAVPPDLGTLSQPVSPFVSGSLSRPSTDSERCRPKMSGEYGGANGSSELRSIRLTGPRALTSRKVSNPDNISLSSSSPFESEPQSFGNSLRRKLSWGRRRSHSRSQASTEGIVEVRPLPPQGHDMPPPKLPASATWSGSVFPGSSPTHKPAYLPSRRKALNTSTSIGGDQSHGSSSNVVENPAKNSIPPPTYSTTPTSARTTSNAFDAIHKSLNSKNSTGNLKMRSLDTQLDRDDLLAEEEMKRLASRRKDTEHAAKQIDDLRLKAAPKDRVTPTRALRTGNLNIFERGEVVDYKEIWFCGNSHAQKHVGDLRAATANFGYDDDRGDYNIVFGDHLAYRYEMVDILGKGSFGQVVRCIDYKTGGLVAIKIIRNKKRFHQQALVEVDILQKLKDWDPQSKHSMVSFTQSFYFRGHLCISTELLGMNLYEFIKCHDFKGFSLKLIRRFTKQLLNSLVLLKSHKVIHCDLKPENVLLAHPAHSEIKVIDFGSSCLEHEKVYTYIQSRFYRSPEVILGMTYGMPIDMWSLGCILAELLTGLPIFPGENEQEQLACIMQVFGPPEKHLIEKSSRRKLFFDSLGKPRLTVSSKGKRRRPSSMSLQQALKCDNEAFLDFITCCLRWDPERRLKPEEAIQHEFVTGVKKTVTRSRTQQLTSTTNTNSPIKRYNSMQNPLPGARPLPEPPTTSFKNGNGVRNREISNSSSPNKTTAAARRQSTLNGPLLHPANGVKRASNGTTISGLPGSALPTRATPRRPDLAAAAAAASFRGKQREEAG